MIPKYRRTLLALALVAAMALSAVVLTDVLDDGVDGYADGTKAVIGNDEYSTLSAAVSAATAGATVKLVSDVTESITITDGMDVILDLNGHKITNEAGKHTITVNSGGKITIEGTGTVDNVSHKKASVYNTSGGKTILMNGNYTRSGELGSSPYASGGNSWYVIHNQGDMEIYENVSVTSTGKFSSLIINGDDSPNTKMVIYGGYFEGGVNTLKNGDYATVTIYGGIFINHTLGAILNWNVATINGGYFENSDTDAFVVRNGTLGDETGIGMMTINGGTFNGNSIFSKAHINYGEGTVNVVSGIFSKDFDSTGFVSLAEGSEKVLIGENYCVSKSIIPDINGTVVSDEDSIITDVGTSNNASISMPSASISISGNNAIGNIMVSAESKTFSSAPDAIASYEITIVANTTYTADITVSAIIPYGHVALAYYIDDNGNLIPVQVVSFTSSTVTFRTTHTTPFVIMSEIGTVIAPDDGEEEYPFLPGQGTNVGPQETSSDDSTTLVAAAAAIVVIMLAVVALMVTRNN